MHSIVYVMLFKMLLICTRLTNKMISLIDSVIKHDSISSANCRNAKCLRVLNRKIKVLRQRICDKAYSLIQISDKNDKQ